MTDGGWQMADDRWQMADGGWRMADGGWWMADGGWRMPDGESRLSEHKTESCSSKEDVISIGPGSGRGWQGSRRRARPAPQERPPTIARDNWASATAPVHSCSCSRRRWAEQGGGVDQRRS